MSPRRRERVPVILVGLALTAGACAQVGDPGVAIQSLQAEIAFGVDLPDDEAPAPTASDSLADAGSFDDGSLQVPFRNTIPERFQNIAFTVPAPEVPECPSAGIGASPAKLADEEVGDEPVEGIYRWKRDITVTRVINGTEFELNVAGFENRVVQNVTEAGGVQNPTDEEPGRIYDFEVVRPDGSGQVIIDTFRVNTSPIVRGANVSQNPRGITFTVEDALEDSGVPFDIPDEAQDEIPQQYRPRVGEPNRGLTLIDRAVFDGNGAEVGGFTPQPPVLYLPFPVDAGDLWTSTSTSSRGQVVRVQGVVNRRESVDACGTLLDGWLAELDVVEASSEGSVQRTHELVVSTEFGGLIIGEHIVETGTDEAGNPVTVEASYSIAQVEPDPLPEDAS